MSSLLYIDEDDDNYFNAKGELVSVMSAVEALGNRAPVIGLKNKTHAILMGINNRDHKDIYPWVQEKIIGNKVAFVGERIGIVVSEETECAKEIIQFLRTEYTKYFLGRKEHITVKRLAACLQTLLQRNIQESGRKPHDIGIILAGYDSTGTHVVCVQPDGDFASCKAMVMGYQSDVGIQYLEENLNKFCNTNGLDVLLNYGMDTFTLLSGGAEVTYKDVDVGVIRMNGGFDNLDRDQIRKFLS